MKSVVNVLVISDTHKNISNAIDVISAKKPDYVLHLGDLADDADDIKHIFPNTEVIGVCGNCDWSSFTNAPTERMLDIGGVKILMCHGHTHNVKSGISVYVAYAREKGVDVALFGHTHNPMLDNMGDIIIMNPGTVNTYGWIEVTNGKADARMCSFEE
ncbi:MAG: YfcE family phosphodiesterase [Clostridia bacterium]|nr:YfcE family phosphodiesterase [Clostridia bacterium]